MSDPAESLRETVLRQCEAASPKPWYPKLYAEQAGADREALYGPLNDLRLANLVELTEWVEGKGQGYLITPLGREVLADPLFLSQLRAGKATAAAPPTTGPEPEPTGENRFERGEVARSAFFYPGRVRVAPVLLAINLLVFVASIVYAVSEGVPFGRFIAGGDPIALSKFGGLSAPALAKGEWWRLLTSTFLHFGIMHLAMNMFTLFLLRRVEALWGSGRFLVLYLICGLCGSCAGIYYHPTEGDKFVVLAGASGALWGVMMSEVGWLALNRSHLPPSDVRQALQNILLTLFLNMGVSMLPHVSAGAHFGGGLAGFLCALLLQLHRFGPPTQRTSAGMLLALIPTICLLALSAAMVNDPRLQPFVVKEFRSQVDDRVGRLPPAFEPLEQRADGLYNQASDKRDPAEVERVRSDLRGLVSQAKETADWLNRADPPGPAKSLKDKATKLVETLTPYAEALEKRAGGDGADVTDRRKAYQEAKVAWDAAISK
jgi:rhomboid protease GluP